MIAAISHVREESGVRCYRHKQGEGGKKISVAPPVVRPPPPVVRPPPPVVRPPPRRRRYDDDDDDDDDRRRKLQASSHVDFI